MMPAVSQLRQIRPSFAACGGLLIAIAGLAGSACGQNDLRIRDLCRVQGQETNTLQGIGLVVGLKGTGDGDSKPMARSLARMMSLMGAPVSADFQGQLQLDDVEDAKNVALVFVTATVPESGAQPGDHIDCTVSAIRAKSLEGGQLLLTPLLTPRVDSPQVYALASGPVAVPAGGVPTAGQIGRGCKMEQAVLTEFVSNDSITLVLQAEHSSFATAQYIEDRINDEYRVSFASSQPSSGLQVAAKAIDQMHVSVKVPEVYRDRPVQFISMVLDLPVVNLRGSKRVVIREREGLIVIGQDVMIAPVAISHKNLTISTAAPNAGGFVGTTTDISDDAKTSLQSMVNALNTLSVPTEDIIAIVKALKRQGNLYGDLVIE